MNDARSCQRIVSGSGWCEVDMELAVAKFFFFFQANSSCNFQRFITKVPRDAIFLLGIY